MKNRKQDCKERLSQIQKAISDIGRFVMHVDEKKFIEDDLIHNAVLMQCIIIGEAIAHIDESILAKYDYPWYKVKAFRNLIAHEYFNIKLSAVWEITQRDLLNFKTTIDTIIQKEF
jgi:uncharacterized protein with HEPN domain